MALISYIPVPYTVKLDLIANIYGMKVSSLSVAYEESNGIFKVLRRERERERERERKREKLSASALDFVHEDRDSTSGYNESSICFVGFSARFSGYGCFMCILLHACHVRDVWAGSGGCVDKITRS